MMKLFFIRYTFTDSKYIEITGDRITKQKEIQKVQRTILCYLPVLIALPPNAPSSSFFLIYCYQQCYLYVVRRTTLEDIIIFIIIIKKYNNNNILHHDDDRYGSKYPNPRAATLAAEPVYTTHSYSTSTYM